VLAGGEAGDYLGLYTVGDDLLQVTGRAQLTVLTGPHTGQVEVAADMVSSAPREDVDGWDAMAEATVWCPTGRVAICGLMGDCPDALADLTAGRPGLLRVRVYARNRRPDGQLPDPHTPEQYQVWVWPVDEDTGFRSLCADALHPAVWTPDSARAAGWAMVRLMTLANPDPREVALRRASARAGHALPGPSVDRVQVRRHRSMPAASARAFLHRPADHLGAVADGADLVLPAGEVDIRIRPTTTGERFAGQWRWTKRHDTATAVPDEADSDIDIRVKLGPAGGPADLTVVHSEARAPDAVLLGLVWDHLLDHINQVADGGSPVVHPWVPIFGEMAAGAAAQTEAARRSAAAFDARRWGGEPPTERLRGLPANAIGLARLDRRLLDALADVTPQTQRALARWAARQACAIAGLDTIEWIAAALTALDRGEPLPAPFDDHHQMWERLWDDERVSHTTVTIPTGTPNCSQQAIALPAVPAAAHGDPLVAAVDTIYFAALAYGDQHRDLLAAATNELAATGHARSRPGKGLM
jgi:hypothetical protein